MRRVVITGLGIVSPIGNNAEEVTESLKAGRSGNQALTSGQASDEMELDYSEGAATETPTAR